MTTSNYPNGFPNGVTILGVPVLNAYAGDVYWVDSNQGSDGNKGTRARPFATLDYAVGRCKASNGDLILLAPNHAETLTGASAVAIDVAGVTIVGMGTGAQRPTFLMDGSAAVTVAVSAADATISNCVFPAGHADIVVAIAVTASGCWLDNLEFSDNTTDENFLTPVKATSTTDNNADNLRVTNCRWFSPDAASLEFIEANADVDGMVVSGNYVTHEGTASPLILFATGKDATHCHISRNVLSHKMTANELLVNIDTSANSGIIEWNNVGHADVTTTHDLGIDGLGCRLFENRSTSTDSLSGLLLPAADVNS